jgi:DNA-binding protein H-NS
MPAARESKGRSKVRANGAGRAAASARKNHSGKLPDVSLLSDDDLSALLEVVAQEQAARRERQREEFFASMRERAQELGVEAEELAAELRRTGARSAPDRRAKVAPKYRNPANASETWAGRGVKPKWMQALLTQGRSMDEFRIAT